LSIWGYIDEKGGWASKCRECWLSYMRGVQSAHSLRCWKIGIPYSALRDPERAIEVLSSIVRARSGWDMKYTRDPGLLRIFIRVLSSYTHRREGICSISLDLPLGALGIFLGGLMLSMISSIDCSSIQRGSLAASTIEEDVQNMIRGLEIGGDGLSEALAWCLSWLASSI